MHVLGAEMSVDTLLLSKPYKDIQTSLEGTIQEVVLLEPFYACLCVSVHRHMGGGVSLPRTAWCS